MSRPKIARKSTFIDMTAMCDVAFLLLSFFMLATKFKPDEPVVVVTPASISQVILPDADSADRAASRLQAAGHAISRSTDGVRVDDPWGTTLLLRT